MIQPRNYYVSIASYMVDMKILDDRLTACESKLDRLEVAIKKILKILEEMKK